MKDNELFWKVFFREEEFNRRYHYFIETMEECFAHIKRLEHEIIKEQSKRSCDHERVKQLFEMRKHYLMKLEDIQKIIDSLERKDSYHDFR